MFKLSLEYPNTISPEGLSTMPQQTGRNAHLESKGPASAIEKTSATTEVAPFAYRVASALPDVFRRQTLDLLQV